MGFLARYQNRKWRVPHLGQDVVRFPFWNQITQTLMEQAGFKSRFTHPSNSPEWVSPEGVTGFVRHMANLSSFQKMRPRKEQDRAATLLFPFDFAPIIIDGRFGDNSKWQVDTFIDCIPAVMEAYRNPNSVPAPESEHDALSPIYAGAVASPDCPEWLLKDIVRFTMGDPLRIDPRPCIHKNIFGETSPGYSPHSLEHHQEMLLYTLLSRVITHPNLPVETARYVTYSPGLFVDVGLYAIARSDFSQEVELQYAKWAARISPETNDASIAAHCGLVYRSRLHTIPAQVLDVLATALHPALRGVAAESANTGTETLTKLALDTNNEVRRTVTGNVQASQRIRMLATLR